MRGRFTKAAADVPAGGPPPEIPARAIGATAIEQFKAASELHNAIGKAWDAVHYERGDRTRPLTTTGSTPACTG